MADSTIFLAPTEVEMTAYIEQTTGFLLDVARRQALAEGRAFDLEDPEVLKWVDLQLTVALDDMGYLGPEPADV